MIRNDGSFRDPWGAVYEEGGRIFRTVSPEAAVEIDRVLATGFVAEAQQRGWLIGATPVPADQLPASLPEAARVLEHPRIPVISYPYEWSFGQLQAAALLHLDLQILALDKGVVLRDATAFNVQFVGHRPIFIDFLSLRPYRPGEFWTAQQQFVSQFLAPLVVEAVAGITFQPLLRGHLDGIPLDQAARMLPASSWLSPSLVLNLLLPDRLQRGSRKSDAAQLESTTKRELPQSAYRSLLTSLRGYIAGLRPRTDPTTWSDYAATNTYSDEEAKTKAAFVAEFVAAARPAVLLDVGCNTGTYSEVALTAGAGRVVGLDLDPAAVHGAWSRARDKDLAFLPLVQDLANSSPGLGWGLKERAPLPGRVRADAVIALALEHHLILGRNIPPDAFFDWLLSLAPRGVVEFVQKTDPTVKIMLALREDVFPWYTEEDFARRLAARARIVRTQVTSSAGRTLYWFEPKE